jgi:hypothetical protein
LSLPYRRASPIRSSRVCGNEVICHDSRIDQYVPIIKTPFKDAVLTAFSEETDGPGVTGF